MTTIPRHVIIEQYLRKGTAEQIAYALTFHYRTRVNASIKALTGAEVARVWAAELEINTPLRLLGERPADGFEPSDKLALAEAMMVAA